MPVGETVKLFGQFGRGFFTNGGRCGFLNFYGTGIAMKNSNEITVWFLLAQKARPLGEHLKPCSSHVRGHANMPEYLSVSGFPNGDRRAGIERRQFSYTGVIPERRSGRERRSGKDRRGADTRLADTGARCRMCDRCGPEVVHSL